MDLCNLVLVCACSNWSVNIDFDSLFFLLRLEFQRSKSISNVLLKHSFRSIDFCFSVFIVDRSMETLCHSQVVFSGSLGYSVILFRK